MSSSTGLGLFLAHTVLPGTKEAGGPVPERSVVQPDRGSAQELNGRPRELRKELEKVGIGS